MIKPIFTMGLPSYFNEENDGSEDRTITDLLVSITNIIGDDYYTLVYFLPTQCDKPEFQVFYEKDFDEVKYEELKSIIIDKINKK